ncbi:MAG TPA: hypothetical protein VHO07_27100 [Streptosporangiaceae bacterium]|jgi:hypothetical protein|nr:hypothetical protein [Streptosporangiaceae bacterium]
MTTDTAPFDATATRITVDPAIAQVPHGHFLLVDTLTDALPNHGQS